MADVYNEQVTDDAAAREAALVAVELTESGGPTDKKWIARALRAVADRARAAVANATATARKGADSARRGVGTAGRGVTVGMSWLTAQVLAMGPRLRIRDQA